MYLLTRWNSEFGVERKENRVGTSSKLRTKVLVLSFHFPLHWSSSPKMMARQAIPNFSSNAGLRYDLRKFWPNFPFFTWIEQFPEAKSFSPAFYFPCALDQHLHTLCFCLDIKSLFSIFYCCWLDIEILHVRFITVYMLYIFVILIIDTCVLNIVGLFECHWCLHRTVHRNWW